MVSYDAKLSESNIPPSKLWNRTITLLLTAASRKLSKGTESSRRGWRCRIGGTAFDFSGRSNALSRVRVPLRLHVVRVALPPRAGRSPAIAVRLAAREKIRDGGNFTRRQLRGGCPRPGFPAMPVGAVRINDLLLRRIVGDIAEEHLQPIARSHPIGRDGFDHPPSTTPERTPDWCDGGAGGRRAWRGATVRRKIRPPWPIQLEPPAAVPQ